MISAEELLKPISEGQPCGEDLYYDPGFQELEGLMKGKPETQFAPAEDPDWKALHNRCVELFTRSKDLRVATALCLAALKCDGLPALREALLVLQGLLERYWEPVYPKLDPEDNNDPLYRVNIIAALATAKGTFGDPMRFLDRLNEAPLADSMQLGRFGLADIVRSQSPAKGNAEGVASLAAQIEAAFRDTSPEVVRANYQAATDSLVAVQAIDTFLTNTIGADKAPDLGLLETELKAITKALIPYLPAGVASPLEGEAETIPAAAGTGAALQTITGEIQTRQDAMRMLEKICQYYSKCEPSSPVPNLLRRAQRLAEMDFLQIVNELCPDGVSQVRTITGEKAETG